MKNSYIDEVEEAWVSFNAIRNSLAETYAYREVNNWDVENITDEQILQHKLLAVSEKDYTWMCIIDVCGVQSSPIAVYWKKCKLEYKGY